MRGSNGDVSILPSNWLKLLTSSSILINGTMPVYTISGDSRIVAFY